MELRRAVPPPAALRPATGGPPGVGVPLALLTRLARRVEWRALIVLVIALDGAGALLLLIFLQRDAPGFVDHPVAFVGAGVWFCIVVFVLVRRRLGRADGGAVVCLTVVLLTVEGVLFQDPQMRWMCLTSLVVAPVAAVMFLRPAGIAAVTAGCMAGAAAITSTFETDLPMKVYSGVTMVSMVGVPVIVVTLLLRKMEGARNLARHLARTDQLTGLLNRRGMRDGAPALVAGAVRAGESVTVMVADLDHFKRINDTHGHDQGDRLLEAVAQAMAGVTRQGSLLVRLGGEEIAWVDHFPTTTAVESAAERLRAAVAAVRVEGLPPVTVSVGVTTGPATAGTDPALLVTSMLTTADRALYEAKHGGRDRVVFLPHDAVVDRRRPTP